MSLAQKLHAAPDEPGPTESLAERRARLMAQHAAVNEAPKEDFPQTVADLIARAGELAALPQVVMQVIELTGNQNTAAFEVERVIGNDQALTAKILTLANSSYYGVPRRISSIREAIVFLGFKTVRNLAMTVTSFNLFLGKSDAQSLARRAQWKHSLNAGLCGKHIASAVPGAAISEELYTAALLHDIGKVLMHQHLTRLFVQAAHAAEERGVAFHQVEQEFLPFTHAEVGAALATRWNLPPVLVEAIGYHHHPADAPSEPHTCAAVTLANDLANAFGDGAEGETPAVIAGELALSEDAIRILGIAPDALQRVATACATELHAGAALTTLL